MTKERRSSMAEMPESTARGYGRNPESSTGGVSSVAATEEQPRPEAEHLMEAVVERKNMVAAYKRVVSNKGSAGVDEMTVEDLATHLREHWPDIKEQLLQGTYEPQAVRGVEIPKPGKKGTRRLGIPTVVDRLIQQAMLQVLHPVFDPGFSESSYGFRPGRSAHQAVLRAQEYAQASYTWVVDLDLEKFFDRVNHDMLMARVARKVKDKRVLKTIRRFLQAGMMEQGLVSPRREGTPQGGPLSPLLSNIMLDDLDKELERRGHRFCRYADDCNVYVQSQRAGERVLESMTTFLTKRLKLKVNEEKSAVDRLWNRSFLGYTVLPGKLSRLRVSPESVKRLRGKLRQILRMARGWSIGRTIEHLKPILRGWGNYFKLSEVKAAFEQQDQWLRRRLRCKLWRQWKRTLTRARMLMKRGLPEERARKSATNGRGPWWNSGASHMNHAYPKSYFDRCGLISLLDLMRTHWSYS
jgi:RNA-directed DNA polymerase